MNKIIPAGRFKQGFLAILDDVAQRHETVTITKRGRPVARLVPVESSAEREEAILRQLRSGSEFLRPTVDEAGWALADTNEKR